MAANDEFPRNYTLNSATNGATGTVAIIAVPGITHICESITLRLYTNSGTAFAAAVFLQDGPATIWQWVLIANTPLIPDDVQVPLNIAGTVGNSMNVTYQSFTAVSSELITATFRDI